MFTIDINCDVGEGMDNEASLMPFISSCNIACGAHAGNIAIIDQVIQLAQKHQVKIGAHPSYPDKNNFGRKVMDISTEELTKSLIQQIECIQTRLKAFGKGNLNHIKAHGALYSQSVIDPKIAEIIISSVKRTAPNATLYVPFNSVIEKLAIRHQLKIKYEVFADRNYLDDLSLVPRSQENAVITDKRDVVNHLLRMVIERTVKTNSNKLIAIKAETCCVHGDNKAAIEIVKFIHQSLKKKTELPLTDFLTYKPFGNRAILVEWPAKIDDQIIEDIIQFKERLIIDLNHKVEDCVIGYHSLTVLYINEFFAFEAEKEILQSIYLKERSGFRITRSLWKIPVCYDRTYGTDLEEISQTNELSTNEIVRLHSNAIYTVYFIGFLPGFLYLGGLDKRLNINRKASPRLKVSKGSVAIGGAQTGIYPVDSAGGWNVIGKTPISFFNIENKNPCFAKAGDKIQFIPIHLNEFKKLEKEVNNGTYQLLVHHLE